jgi:DNA-directed RNA polymerase specialized sigma24 family protein
MMDFLTSAYLSLRDLLRGRAQRITGRPDEAEDALQEAFYRLWARKYVIGSEREALGIVRHIIEEALTPTQRYILERKQF